MGRLLGARRKSPEEFTALLATPYAPRYPREAFAALLWASQTLLRLIATAADAQAADVARSERASSRRASGKGRGRATPIRCAFCGRRTKRGFLGIGSPDRGFSSAGAEISAP